MNPLRAARLVVGCHVDDDRAAIAVAESRGGRWTPRDEWTGPAEHVAATIESLRTTGLGVRRNVEVIVALEGDSVVHRVVRTASEGDTKPARLLAATLASTSWHSLDWLSSAQLVLAHRFERETCILAVAPRAALDALGRLVQGGPLRVTTEAACLLDLLGREMPEAFQRGAETIVGVSCSQGSLSVGVLSNGAPRVLDQTSLPPDDTITHERYAAIARRFVEEAIEVYCEQWPDAQTPTKLVLTGTALARQGLGDLVRLALADLGFAVHELSDATAPSGDLAPSELRHARALLAVGTTRTVLEFGSEARTEWLAKRVGSTRSREPRRLRLSRGDLAAGALAATVVTSAMFATSAFHHQIVIDAFERRIAVEAGCAATLEAEIERREAAAARASETRRAIAGLGREDARGAATRLIDAVVERLPPGVRLDRMSLEADAVRIGGIAESPDAPGTLARELEGLVSDFARVTCEVDVNRSGPGALVPAHEKTGSQHPFEIACWRGASPIAAAAGRECSSFVSRISTEGE